MISVCIPVYNGEKFVRECVESCLAQTYRDFEVVVVDNCSTDTTAEILKSFNDERLRIITAPDHVPLAENFQRAGQGAEGTHVLMLSADDVLCPDALSIFAKAIKENPSVAVFSGQAGRIIEGEARDLGAPQFSLQSGLVRDLEYLVIKNPFPLNINATLFQKEIIDMRVEAKMAFDLDMMISIGRKGNSVFLIDEKVIKYREHEGGASANKVLLWRETLSVYDYHYASTSHQGILRKRIFRTLFWCVGTLAQEGEKLQARQLISEFGGYLNGPEKVLLKTLSVSPAVILGPAFLLRKLRGFLVKS